MQNIVRAARERKIAKGDEGFTLIELLIVIVVLGILWAFLREIKSSDFNQS